MPKLTTVQPQQKAYSNTLCMLSRNLKKQKEQLNFTKKHVFFREARQFKNTSKQRLLLETQLSNVLKNREIDEKNGLLTKSDKCKNLQTPQ